MKQNQFTPIKKENSIQYFFLHILVSFEKTLSFLKKIAFIINPTTHRAHLVTKKLVESILPRHEFECSFYYTEYSGHATKIANQIISENQHNIITSVGGCGTLHECIQAASYKSIQFAIIPTGAGNAMAYHLKIPTNIKKAIQIIRDGNVNKMDIARIFQKKTNQSKLFLCYFAVGFSPFLAEKTAKIHKRHFYNYLYINRLIRIWKSFSYPNLELTFNFETKQIQPFELFIGNINRYGRRVKVSSRCSVKDNTLEVNIVTKVAAKRFMSFIIKSILNTPDDIFDINELHLSEAIIIKFNEPTLTQVDFEPVIFDDQVNITVLPTALNIIIPKTTVKI